MHEVEHHMHESPSSMTVPLMILAGLSIVGGWIGWPESLGGSDRFAQFPRTGDRASTPKQRRRRGQRRPGIGTEYVLMLASVLVALRRHLAGVQLVHQAARKCPSKIRGAASAACTSCSTTSITWTRFTTRCS